MPNTLVNELVSVLFTFNAETKAIKPQKLKWRGRVYPITKIGYYHKVRIGRNLLHIFSVCNDSLAFKLCLDSDNLHWTLQEVYENS